MRIALCIAVLFGTCATSVLASPEGDRVERECQAKINWNAPGWGQANFLCGLEKIKAEDELYNKQNPGRKKNSFENFDTERYNARQDYNSAVEGVYRDNRLYRSRVIGD